MRKLAPLGPDDEALWEYTKRTVDKVLAGKRVRGWHKIRTPKLPRIALEVKVVRHSLGVSQKEMADIIGASLATVKAWESGARKPDGVATKVLRLLGHEPAMAKRFAKIML
jgi:DNA-binding transcriptional regulator YiaG